MTAPGVKLWLEPGQCDAVLFDMDGVLTDTARVHATAWKRTFDEYLHTQDENGARRPFDADREYRRLVDGKPREEGVRSFLAARGLSIDEGSPDDAPGRPTVHGLGNRKNALFLEILERDGAGLFEDAIDLVRRLRGANVPTAVISSSRNARRVLEKAEILDLFDVVVDGVVAEEAGLEGKPAPDVFLKAARRLAVPPDRAAAFEDATSGVVAASRGGFGWVIGVSRGTRAEDLVAAGADVVVCDLAEIGLSQRRRSEGRSIGELPDALDHLSDIRETIGDRRPLWCLDFDGTLAPIVENPSDAALPAATRRLLAELAERVIVAVVSGRDLDDLQSRVGVEGVYYAGSHGARLAGPNGWRREPSGDREVLPALDAAERDLRARLAQLAGVDLERKRYALAIHTRRADPDARDAARRAARDARDENEELELTRGREVLELRSGQSWDKGDAVDWLRKKMSSDGLGREICPIYVGDDVTDEDAFDAVRTDGVAIVVAGRTGRTSARYRLDDVAAVRRLIEEVGEEQR